MCVLDFENETINSKNKTRISSKVLKLISNLNYCYLVGAAFEKKLRIVVD